jgi:hypothetical protein
MKEIDTQVGKKHLTPPLEPTASSVFHDVHLFGGSASWR